MNEPRPHAGRSRIALFIVTAVVLLMLPLIIFVVQEQQDVRQRASGAYFATLAPGSKLPSEQECAIRVRKSTWEPRPENQQANNTNVYMQGYRLSGSELAKYGQGFESRVTGNFTGTTDEIIQWAACKWGFDENIVRAQASVTSNWRQIQLGECTGAAHPETNGCQDVGIMQVDSASLQSENPGTWPYTKTSTAFNLDYTLALQRACYDGKEAGTGYKTGDLWACIGKADTGTSLAGSTSNEYVTDVKRAYSNKDWNKYGAGPAPTIPYVSQAPYVSEAPYVTETPYEDPYAYVTPTPDYGYTTPTPTTYEQPNAYATATPTPYVTSAPYDPYNPTPTTYYYNRGGTSYTTPTPTPTTYYQQPNATPTTYYNDPYAKPTSPYVVPSFFCLAAPCPVTPDPTMTQTPDDNPGNDDENNGNDGDDGEDGDEDNDENGDGVDDSPEPTSIESAPSEDPCAGTASLAGKGRHNRGDSDDEDGNRHNRDRDERGDVSGFGEQLLRMFIEILNLLIRLLGGGAPIQPPGQPNPCPPTQAPQPSIDPAVPSESPIDPLPSSNVPVDPSPSAAPSTVVSLPVTVVPSTVTPSQPLPSPSVTISVVPSMATPSADPSPSIPVPTDDPCATTASLAADEGSSISKHNRHEGILSRFFEFLIQFFMRIFSLFMPNQGNPQTPGSNPLSPPPAAPTDPGTPITLAPEPTTTPVGGTPIPSNATPSIPVVTDPAQISTTPNPCPSPSSETPLDPTTGPEPTSTPSPTPTVTPTVPVFPTREIPTIQPTVTGRP